MRHPSFLSVVLVLTIAPFVVSLVEPQLLLAQPDTLWTKTYGGTNDDRGWSVAQTGDGGYIVAGYTESFGVGDYDVYLIRTNANGDTLWTKTYGGTYKDEGWSVALTEDGGYVVAGYTESFGAGDYDAYLIRTDANGDTLWTKTYGSAYHERIWSVAQTEDGGYIMGGYIWWVGEGDYDVYLIRTDANGDTLWTKTYGGPDDDRGWSVARTKDGGYIVSGWTYSFGPGGEDVYLIRTDGNGDTLWTKAYGGADYDRGWSVAQTADDGYIVVGSTSSLGAGGNDVYLIKTDAEGDTLWTKTYGGTEGDNGYSVFQTADGGYIVSGYTWSFGAGGQDIYLIRTDAEGDTLWTKTFGGTQFEGGWTVAKTADGGYIVSGYTSSFGAGDYDAYLIRLASELPVSCEFTLLQHQVPRTGTLDFTKTWTNNFSDPITVDGHFEIYRGSSLMKTIHYASFIIQGNESKTRVYALGPLPGNTPLDVFTIINKVYADGDSCQCEEEFEVLDVGWVD